MNKEMGYLGHCTEIKSNHSLVFEGGEGKTGVRHGEKPLRAE